ncbi:phospholipase A2 A2-actitoxin-Ucs2a isoform X2 [Cherax quadricarinatus]|uniref:phospholipase A2 A2-actitoxin-Ucs2a isoform X2 n=1 Tax=Cherax quadricarinatus TaxID=27406 RepID=UPI00237805E2|nr:phospholipase A2 A2-actitoxin-Ucs2a-like isoform X2 [Cherax quadricarinatus]
MMKFNDVHLVIKEPTFRRYSALEELSNSSNSQSNNNNSDNSLQPTWIEVRTEEQSASSSRRKRSVFHLFNMMTCATDCNPLSYKGYGCYCGFLGSGLVVDGIDRCCKGHDWCYEHAKCRGLDHYLAPYKWKCNGGKPYCVTTNVRTGAVDSCGHQLCECDREFVECLKQHPCPRSKAVCMTSPWRYWQNLFMGMTSGMGLHQHDSRHPTSPPPSYQHLNETPIIS